MFIINENNVEKSINMKNAVSVIEDALIKYDKGDYNQPARTFSQIEDENNLMLMPCFVDDSIGLKVVTSYPSNAGNDEGFPVTQGIIMINDIVTGEPLSLINGTLLTAIKTGAVSGVAMKYLKKDAKTVGLAGTGLQGMYQLVAALATTSVETIYLYNRTPEKISAFIKKFNELTDTEVYTVPVFDTKTLVNKSDIIITATTALSPVLPDEDIYDDKLVIAVGSYKENMRELPEVVFRKTDRLYVDSLDGKNESGDIIDPLKKKWIKEDGLTPISDITTGKLTHQNDSKPIVFKNINMALFDAMIGNHVYKEAKKHGYGTKVDF